MHNAAYDAMSLDFCYVPFLVNPDDLGVAVHSVRALNIRGMNVTVPHKEKVMAYLDEIDTEASFIGAVNTIVNAEGRLIGYNTDGRGFIKSLSEHSIRLSNKHILIIGAGGAARAVGYSLVKRVKSLAVFGRTRMRVENLVCDLNRVNNIVSLCPNSSELDRFHMIINATPLGLKAEDPLPIDASFLKAGQIVYDLIYKKTKLLTVAAKKRCVAIDGLDMLLWQGALAFKLWTGKKPDIDSMRRGLNA